MKRILFVDDEPNVLNALRNVLRKQRQAWDMKFVPSGEAALAELSATPQDVIVTDMRMPGMDGAELLQQVREKFPGVARIVLSGYADQDAVVRAIPVAHQYLSKPCDVEVLRHAIERTCSLQTVLENEPIRRVVCQIDRLPSVPRTYYDLASAVARPGASAADLAQIIETDPAMSAKILQLANSAYFGTAQRKLSVTAAVAYLGVELLKALALTAHIFAALDRAPISIPGFSLERLQETALRGANLARAFASDRTTGEVAFTATVVRDIGRVLLAVHLPERYSEVVRLASEPNRSLLEAEQVVLGVSHSAVGAYLLGVWGLPFPIVELVAYHHLPSLMEHPTSPRLLAAVHVASVIADQESLGLAACVGADLNVDEEYLQRNELTEESQVWLARAASLRDK